MTRRAVELLLLTLGVASCAVLQGPAPAQIPASLVVPPRDHYRTEPRPARHDRPKPAARSDDISDRQAVIDQQLDAISAQIKEIRDRLKPPQDQ